MTDELFDYFGKGSKKFEPLDDDLDLPEVSPKRNVDDKSETNDLKPTEGIPAQDEISAATEPTVDATDSADGGSFAGFGAGLFEDTTEELPPRKQAPAVKSTATPLAATESKPKANSVAKAKSKPVDSKPVKQEVAAVEKSESTDDSEGGTWDFLAGVLGIGGKKSKPTEATADNALQAKVEVAESKPKPKNVSSADTIREEPQAAVDSLFNTTDDGLDLAGWGDEPEEPVAAEEPTALTSESDRSRSGRGRRPKRNQEDRSSKPQTDSPVDGEANDDENFIEFEVEELSPSARGKKEDSSKDRPRRRRRPVRESNDEEETETRERNPRSRSRKDSDDNNESRSRSGGRGRNRGRGRGRGGQDNDRETGSRETVARSKPDSGSDDWQDEKPDTGSRNERSRGSRGRGRKRPQRQSQESKQIDDDFIDEDLEVMSFTDGDDDFDKEVPAKKSRRPRRSRGRNRDDDDRDAGEKETVSRRGDSKRGDRDSESSSRRRRGSRGNSDRDSSRNEKRPQYAEVPTWDETIESMIASNIKNHESSSNRGRGGRNNGGRNNGGRNRGGNSRNGGGRNRR